MKTYDFKKCNTLKMHGISTGGSTWKVEIILNNFFPCTAAEIRKMLKLFVDVSEEQWTDNIAETIYEYLVYALRENISKISNKDIKKYVSNIEIVAKKYGFPELSEKAPELYEAVKISGNGKTVKRSENISNNENIK